MGQRERGVSAMRQSKHAMRRGIRCWWKKAQRTIYGNSVRCGEQADDDGVEVSRQGLALDLLEDVVAVALGDGFLKGDQYIKERRNAGNAPTSSIRGQVDTEQRREEF
jgi:hypothetical protein